MSRPPAPGRRWPRTRFQDFQVLVGFGATWSPSPISRVAFSSCILPQRLDQRRREKLYRVVATVVGRLGGLLGAARPGGRRDASVESS